VSPLEPAEVPAALRGLRIATLVSGGIAAYKVVDLVSRLTQAGCEVRVGMTAGATRFVGPATFRGVSGRQVQVDLWSGEHAEPHVELGDWAQLVLLAPATANVLARAAHGQADDLVTATLLAARCPVIVAPAMNDAMWSKPAVRENVETLRSHGCLVVEPEAGHLASGHVGEGRLAGAQAIFSAMEEAVQARYDLGGRRVVVSAGGTREPIDPVRFLSNYSSGKMGFAVAAAAADRGAEVALVTTASHPPHAGVRLLHVETAAEMLDALRAELGGAHLLVMAAAVADFRPAERSLEKIRREERSELVLRLQKNTDILAELAHEPGAEGVFRLGFAAEDGAVEERAAEKIERKGLDAILANDVSRHDIAFGSEHNAGLLLFRDGTRVELERMTKREMADRMLDAVVPRLT
jgi:phosphopantothenoylcysteine decarboxylase/phosphopantothenate--cysteine ligase